MINYNRPNDKSLDSWYSADDIAALKEKWKKEENRLKTADICGFNGGLGVNGVSSKSAHIDLSREQLSSLQEGAKRYRFNQRMALEREAEKWAAGGSTVEVYADMVRVRTPVQNAPKGGGVREECKGFSDASRRRLIQKMAQWNLNDLSAYFITLTYPGLYTVDWEIWKRDLDTLFKRLQRKYPELVGSCWRVEFQKRGAPHFHLIAVSSKACKSLTLFRLQIAEMWCEIVADGYRLSGGDMAVYVPEQEKHRRVGTGVEAVQGRKQLMAYVSKYLAKVDQANAPDSWGRNWGFRNINGQLDFSPVEIVEVDYCEAVKLKRCIRKWLRSRGRVRYADMLNLRVSYSVLGLGADSIDGRALYKMLGGIRKGLFAPHISPGTPLELGCISGISFLERVQMGLYDTRKALSEGDRVNTSLGKAIVSQVRHCNILDRQRVAVYLDNPQANNARLAIFDVWQCKPCQIGTIKQDSLW